MEHTILANGIRQGHKGGLVLSQLHIGLAVGFAIVACLTAFGGGIIVGMWYKVDEQIAPVSASVTSTPAESPAQSQETMSQPPEPPAAVTFYNTLTNSSGAYAPLTPPPAPNGPSGSAKGAVAPAPATGTMGGATGSTKAASVSKAMSATAGTTRAAMVNESQKHMKATSAAKAAPAETTASPGGAKTVVQKPTARTRQAGKETGAQQHAGAAAPAKAPGVEDARVPAGSAGSSEKGSLARVQPAAVPGQGPRYRIRLGGDTERTAADQTAQRLTAQEQVPAIVAGRD